VVGLWARSLNVSLARFPYFTRNLSGVPYGKEARSFRWSQPFNNGRSLRICFPSPTFGEFPREFPLLFSSPIFLPLRHTFPVSLQVFLSLRLAFNVFSASIVRRRPPYEFLSFFFVLPQTQAFFLFKETPCATAFPKPSFEASSSVLKLFIASVVFFHLPCHPPFSGPLSPGCHFKFRSSKAHLIADNLAAPELVSPTPSPVRKRPSEQEYEL